MKKGTEPQHRICASCGTTDTSQWRYGQTINILLCNACGIRWKRKNKTISTGRMKPGPKSKPSSSKAISPRFSINLKPTSNSPLLVPGCLERETRNNSTISSDFDTNNLNDQSNEQFNRSSSSSSSTQTKQKNKTPRCPKMSLDSLICSNNSEPNEFVSRNIQHRNRNEVIPFRITSLLNCSEDGFNPIL